MSYFLKTVFLILAVATAGAGELHAREAGNDGLTSTVQLRVMTFNIHHGADSQNRDRLSEMAEVITQSGADIVGLQEVDINCNRSGKVDQMAKFAELTGMHPAYAEHFPYDGGSYGLGLLSRYPLSEIENHRLTLIGKDGTTETRALLAAVATLPGNRKVLVATVHMALSQPGRVIQAREILNYLDTDAMPVILTGDMNAEPGTEEIKLLETVFEDTDSADKLTFPVDPPTRKIDYIYVSKDALKSVISHEVLTAQKQSDHLPALAEVGVIVAPASAVDTRELQEAVPN